MGPWASIYGRVGSRGSASAWTYGGSPCGPEVCAGAMGSSLGPGVRRWYHEVTPRSLGSSLVP